MKNVKGFTLLELMIAVSLGVILLGIGAPALSSLLSGNALHFESRNILKNMRFARSQAIDNQTVVTACLADANDNCVTADPSHFLVFIDDNANDVLNNGEQVLVRSADFPSSLTATNSITSSTFSPDGTRDIDDEDEHVISLCISGNAQVNLVTPPSGRTRQETQAFICQ
ncbi:GspH/FimT family pseudopilin [Aeromonas caviae]|nr:GspH/FimT family pseudopilin [Aeromonas caviae]MBL0576056.1 GspH/FimT family pseudopilin [Aeromonas caviae]MCU9924000.1 GspH/FimT family pseudopilin [Aeromonas caviae]MDX7716268.1 GspH/FimT family pseudopilin [Aeromonas caviae]MDX7855667.1 GspH/FimT family pseudopilin [Aeromonas caviae]MEA9416886.1 GspH/FimT family pseudopilin [Aeromonas caviae]